jgi:predicted DCC family thiol-disulfide oxidoreductase YuxK
VPDATRTGSVPAPTDHGPTTLTILYDERCAFCLRCRDWLATQPCLVPVELLAAGSAEAHRRYGSMPWLGKELVVVDGSGRVWAGPPAFLMSLWATARYRAWSYTLSKPGAERHAERFFHYVSRRRGAWGSRLERRDPECSSCVDARPSWDAG